MLTLSAFEQKLTKNQLFRDYFNIYNQNFENKIRFENGEFEFFKNPNEKLYKTSDNQTALNWAYNNRYLHFINSHSNENYCLSEILKMKSIKDFEDFSSSLEDSIGKKLVDCWRTCYRIIMSSHDFLIENVQPTISKNAIKTLQSFRGEFHVLTKYKCLKIGVSSLDQVMKTIENDL